MLGHHERVPVLRRGGVEESLVVDLAVGSGYRSVAWRQHQVVGPLAGLGHLLPADLVKPVRGLPDRLVDSGLGYVGLLWLEALDRGSYDLTGTYGDLDVVTLVVDHGGEGRWGLCFSLQRHF